LGKTAIDVFNAQNLGKDAQVRSVSFTLSGLRQFHHYRYFEWIGLSKADKNDLQALKKLRKKDGSPKGFFVSGVLGPL
jgi:hypothetical protein